MSKMVEARVTKFNANIHAMSYHRRPCNGNVHLLIVLRDGHTQR